MDWEPVRDGAAERTRRPSAIALTSTVGRRSGPQGGATPIGESFAAIVELLKEVATAEHGRPPASIVLLSGDIHHCYLAEVGFPRATDAQSVVWQAVCSAFRKDLARREKVAMKLGNSDFGWALTRALARSAGVRHPPVGWRMHQHPIYNNQAATLHLEPGHASVKVETTINSHWRDPRLSAGFEQELTSEAPRTAA